MEEIVVQPAAQTLCQSLLTAINDQLKYVCSYGKYIKDLDDGLTQLENTRQRVQEDVDRADRNAEIIYDDVTTWLGEVEKIIKQATEVVEKHENSKIGCCFRGVIPNPSARFRIARLAERNKQEIDKFQMNRHFPTVSHPHVPAELVTGNYKGPEYGWIARSRESLLEVISKTLLDDNIRIVGIWGAAGVGKSTFLKQLVKQVQERKLNFDFDAVTMATVSRSPNWEKVQDDLSYRLGLKMKEENSVDQKAVRLRERLSQRGKILIILDDIWDKVDLEELGIPFDDSHRNIKVLLTSRSKQVLEGKMASESNFCLHPLEECEAVDLFEYIVGDRARNEAALINRLAKECAGLLILISLWSTSLKTRPPSDWVKALGALRRSNNPEIEKLVEESLQFNYHLMKSDEEKFLLLLCGQIGCPIIPVEDILIYGLGLGLLRGIHTMEDAREKVKLLLDNLKISCLLEDSGGGYVKLHDLMGDAARSIASKTYTSLVIRNGKLLKECSEDDLTRCKSITIYLGDDMHELPERIICPALDMLLIYTKDFRSTRLEIFDEFFNDTRELKVLDLSDLIITSLPSSIQLLSKLHTLCLGNVEVGDVAIIGKLKTLQSLTFRGSKISRIPKEFGELNNLKLLNLRGCRQLEVIEPNVLGNLIHMEELYLPISFDKWDAEGTSNASLTELSNMSRLSSLEICVPDADSLPNDMPFQQLVRYKILIGKLWYCEDFGEASLTELNNMSRLSSLEISVADAASLSNDMPFEQLVRHKILLGKLWYWGDFSEARTLKLEFNSSNSRLILKDWLQTALKKTQDLYVHGWIGIEEIFTKLFKEGFPELKHFHVENCPSIQYIFHSNQPDPFPVLESLSLYGLINLRMICNGNLPLISLINLKVIKIEACDKLRNLLPFSLVKDLPMLEEVVVSDCPVIQEIITYLEVDERIDRKGRLVDRVEMLELKGLRKLKLVNLQNISSFRSKESREIIEDDGNSLMEFFDGRQVSFPCLESLTLCKLPNLRKISNSQYPVNLQSLKSLELLKCKSLLYALDSNLLLQLRNLESLVIEDCESMETVFHMEELNIHDAILNQSLQINLKLCNLPRLKKIWNTNPQEIPSILELKEPEVSKCDELENLFSAAMVESLGKIARISIDSCMTMQEVFLEKEDDDQEIKFSSLSYLNISEMENLMMFSHGNHHYQFPCLTQLIICRCPKMRAFVSVKHGKEEHSGKVATGDEPFFNEKVVLPKLEKLVLSLLGSVTSIWGDNNLSEHSFCELTSIEIENCARIQSIFLSHLMERLQNLTKVRLLDLPQLRHVVTKDYILEEEVLPFPRLRDIFVENCHGLTYLFRNTIAKGLFELVHMYISSCKDLQEIVSFDVEQGDAAMIEAMRFYKLSSLQLENLDSLVHFCSGHYELYFPNLKKLSIIGCIKLKSFILRPSNLVRAEEQFQKISSTSNIEVGFSPLVDEKVVFPNLEELQIKGLLVKEIWPRKELASFLMELKVLMV